MPHFKKQMASFFLTTKCNPHCKYCYNREQREPEKEQSLSLDIAKAGIDYFFSTNESRHIRFYGPGEPTREFPLMKDIVGYARVKAGGLVTVELQTNGVFDKEVRQWLLDNVNIIWISFDGEPAIHDANRKFKDGRPSSPVIEENVKWLIGNKGANNLLVGARVTVTNETVRKQKRIVDYLAALGIRYIWNDPLFPSVGTRPVCDDEAKMGAFTFDMDGYVDGYIEAYRYAAAGGIFYGSFLTCNFDGVCDKHCRACIPVPHFTTDGYVSACDLVTFGENARHMDCFVYGKWDKEAGGFVFDKNKIQKLRDRTTVNMPHCRECGVREHCGGYCLGEVMNESGRLLGQKPVTCGAIRRIAKEIGFPLEAYRYPHP